MSVSGMSRASRPALLVAVAALAAAALAIIPQVAARGDVQYIEWHADRGSNQQYFELGNVRQSYDSGVFPVWELDPPSSLVEIDWVGPPDSYLHYSDRQRQRHGVASPGDGRDFQDSISGDEAVVFRTGASLGGRVFTGAALKIDNAGNQGVVVAAAAELFGEPVDLFMYAGDCGPSRPAAPQEAITIEPNDDLKLFCFEAASGSDEDGWTAGGGFDEISFSADAANPNGRFAFAGFEPYSKFYLTSGPLPNTTLECPEGGDEAGPTVTVNGEEVLSELTALDCNDKTDIDIYVDSYVAGSERVLDVIFTSEDECDPDSPPAGAGANYCTATVEAVNTWDPEPAASAYEATLYDPDPLDGVTERIPVKFCSDPDLGEDEPVCTLFVTMDDQDDGTVVRTETNLIFADPGLIRPR